MVHARRSNAAVWVVMCCSIGAAAFKSVMVAKSWVLAARLGAMQQANEPEPGRSLPRLKIA